VPVPRPGETFSSILLRLARNHAASAHELCAMLWPGRQFWTRDIDRTAGDKMIEAVARDTGLSRAKLEAATLRGLVKALGFPERLQGSQRGILPVGVYHRVRRRFGQQYCPVCLAADPPYLRRVWRLEIMVVCPEHGVLLRDACPSCDAPFIPHRDHSLVRHRCHHCGSPLTLGHAGNVTPRAAMLQQAALRTLSGLLEDVADALEHSAIPAPHWPALQGIGDRELLDGIHRLCQTAAHLSETGPVDHSESHRQTWTLLRTRERVVVMEQVGAWLADWPHAWTGWARKRGLTRHFLEVSHGPWPDWVKKGFEDIPYSFGPVGIRRHRAHGLGVPRGRFASMGLWREARARALLRRAGVSGVGPK
jgi:hypothetical protein